MKSHRQFTGLIEGKTYASDSRFLVIHPTQGLIYEISTPAAATRFMRREKSRCSDKGIAFTARLFVREGSNQWQHLPAARWPKVQDWYRLGCEHFEALRVCQETAEKLSPEIGMPPTPTVTGLSVTQWMECLQERTQALKSA